MTLATTSKILFSNLTYLFLTCFLVILIGCSKSETAPTGKGKLIVTVLNCRDFPYKVLVDGKEVGEVTSNIPSGTAYFGIKGAVSLELPVGSYIVQVVGGWAKVTLVIEEGKTLVYDPRCN